MKRWQEKRVVVLGIARQGKALARFLTSQGASVVMSDVKTKEQLAQVLTELSDIELTYVFGGHPLDLLEGADALFLSGGVPTQLPIVEEARRRGIALLNDAQITLEHCPAKLIGITGSAGKTTTTTLVYEMARSGLADGDRSVWLGGNIGRPLLEDLDQIDVHDLVVMELSSFQLELMTVSPAVAAVLNLTPDHLDRHGSLEAYVEAKRKILAYQTETDVAVLGYDDPRTWALHEQVRGRVIAFGFDSPPDVDSAYVQAGSLTLRTAQGIQPICAVEELALRGRHNTRNILAACALSSAVGVPVEAMASVARTFQGVPHRLEFVRRVRNADWYNDSIATTPDRAMAALGSFEQPLVILLGGRDKDLDWSSFSREVAARARVVILFGEAKEKLKQVFRPLLGRVEQPALYVAEDFETAFNQAVDVVQEGDVVLLSPGCTSYDEFPNFEARGDRFREMVRAL